jgi:hypothetical protein
MSTTTEPRNPLYLLLLVAGLVFVVTAVACAIIPVLEQKAIDAGNPPPPSEFRDYLRSDGWKLLLVQVAVVIVLGIASMVWDRLRTLQNDRAAAKMPDEVPPTSSPPG